MCCIGMLFVSRFMKSRLTCPEVNEGLHGEVENIQLFFPNNRKLANQDQICLSAVTFLHLIRVT